MKAYKTQFLYTLFYVGQIKWRKFCEKTATANNEIYAANLYVPTESHCCLVPVSTTTPAAAAAAVAAGVSASELVTSQHVAASSCRASPVNQMTRRGLLQHTLHIAVKMQ